MNTACSETKGKAVKLAMEELAGKINLAKDRLSLLEEILQPVLGGPVPCDATLNKEPPNACQLASDINGARAQIIILIERINDAITRLEI